VIALREGHPGGRTAMLTADAGAELLASIKAGELEVL